MRRATLIVALAVVLVGVSDPIDGAQTKSGPVTLEALVRVAPAPQMKAQNRNRPRWKAPPAAVRIKAPVPAAPIPGIPGIPGSGEPDWYAIAECESSGRWSLNVGLFWGGLQFLPSTWFAYGGGPFEDHGQPFPYSAAEQIAVAERVLAGQGPGAWPNCFQWAA
jgi:hypothetical protein